MAVTIQIFSDYVCPFCRLGEVAAKQVAAQQGVQLVWRAHQLRAEGPPRLEPQGEVLTKGWRETVYPMADRLGLAMRQPSRLPLTRYAHEAAAWARAQDRFATFHEAIFHAYFNEDADIGEIPVLLQLARNLGLDDNDLLGALNTQRYAEDVDEDLLVGQTYGVTGVPTFIIGGTLLYGVQDLATLTRAVEAVRAGQPVPQAKPQPTLPIGIMGKKV